MKKFSAAALITAIVLGLAACTTGSGGAGATLSISLNSDKNSIFADGADAVQFTVLDNNTREDITSKAEIHLKKDNGTSELYNGTKFSTTIPGTYKFFAKSGETVSSDLVITAVAESAEGIVLKASKDGIYADGGDFSVLTLENADGADVTAQGIFFADGEQLEGNRFCTDKGSFTPVTITATFGGGAVANEVQIVASSSYEFNSRLLIEEITRTNCTYCPITIRIIRELAQDEKQTVVAYNVHNTYSSLWNGFSDVTQGFVFDICDFLKPFGVQNYTTAPYTVVGREKNYPADNITASTFRELALKCPKDVAIAIESSTTASEIKFKATVGSKKDFTGKVLAVLVDNGLSANQADMGVIDMYRVMRAYYPSVEGEAKTFKTKTPVYLEGSFNLSEVKVTDVKNCEIIVIVTDDTDNGACSNVQFAAVGEIKGY